MYLIIIGLQALALLAIANIHMSKKWDKFITEVPFNLQRGAAITAVLALIDTGGILSLFCILHGIISIVFPTT